MVITNGESQLELTYTKEAFLKKLISVESPGVLCRWDSVSDFLLCLIVSLSSALLWVEFVYRQQVVPSEGLWLCSWAQ